MRTRGPHLSPFVWLAAAYHLPATYSCRLPMSSANSAPVSPAPGPATVRLALIRTGIELFGIEHARTVLFPQICLMPIHIRPPERVAISPQMLRAYKAVEESWGTQITEAPISREMAQAEDLLTIYIQVPASDAKTWKGLLQAIGYWGQASSLAWCMHIQESLPPLRECVLPLRQWTTTSQLRPFFSCILSEFRDASVSWDDIMPVIGVPSSRALQLDVYIWPLIFATQQGSGKLLVRTPFPGGSI